MLQSERDEGRLARRARRPVGCVRREPCADASPARSRRARRRAGGRLDVARSGLATDSESIEVGELMFEGLVGWKPGTTDIEPRLATELAGSPGRPDAGRSTCARTSCSTTARRSTPTPSCSRSSACSIHEHPQLARQRAAATGAALLNDVEKVVAIDPLTVEIHVAEAVRAAARQPRDVPDRVAGGGAEVGRRVRRSPRRHRAVRVRGRGSKGERVVVRRFDDYWGTRRGLDRIVFQVDRRRAPAADQPRVGLGRPRDRDPPRRAAVRRAPPRSRARITRRATTSAISR